MPVDWNEVNVRRISEKTQEIRLYCAQRWCDMTPRSFELARISLSNLLDNLMDRNKMYANIPKTIKLSMNRQRDCVAVCSEKQAACLARTVVYDCVGDDLNLYPVKAEQKLQLSKKRGESSCRISEDEVMPWDCLYIVYSLTKGENYTKDTMTAVFSRFQKAGFDPFMARVYSAYFFSINPIIISALPQFSIFLYKYNTAARALVERGYLVSVDTDIYKVTDKRLEL